MATKQQSNKVISLDKKRRIVMAARWGKRTKPIDTPGRRADRKIAQLERLVAEASNKFIAARIYRDGLRAELRRLKALQGKPSR